MWAYIIYVIVANCSSINVIVVVALTGILLSGVMSDKKDGCNTASVTSYFILLLLKRWKSFLEITM